MADVSLIKTSTYEEIIPLQIESGHGCGLRIIEKNGVCRYKAVNVPLGSWRKAKDIFTTLVDTQWRWLWLMFTTSFFLSWFIFAVLWWLIAYLHGDFLPNNLPDQQRASGWKPCTTNIYGFTSAFMFSMENQHTTGFGARMPTEECPQGILLMCLQGIVGVTLQGVGLSTIFVKLIRSKRRLKTLTFSTEAVICLHEGGLCLMARIADSRTTSRVIEARVVMQMLTKEKTSREGLWIIQQKEMEINVNGNGKRTSFFLTWPATLVHRIDEQSPLFFLDAASLAESQIEIVVYLEGTVESTDQRLQARTSYLGSEILWGYQFEPIIRIDSFKSRFLVDFNQLDKVSIAHTPRCSAAEFIQRRLEFVMPEDKQHNDSESQV